MHKALHFALGFAIATATYHLGIADAELDRAASVAGNWAMPGGNEFSHRFSALDQIHRGNVAQLKPAWTHATGVFRGHEGNPLVVGDTMYVHSPFPNHVLAIDLNTRRVIWRYEPRQDPAIPNNMCCDTVSRGLAYGAGMILLQQADTTLVALDARSGQIRWSVVTGDVALGAVNTNAPYVFKDKVITGVSGGGWGVRGYISAYALNSGRLVWRGYSTGPDDEMLIDPQRTSTWAQGQVRPVGANSSLQSWQGDQWRRGGGTTWGWYSYDRTLNLLYYGTGNPGTFNSRQRPGDNRWTVSLWARDLDTGIARWVYQMTPHDEWDYGGTNELILVDLRLQGKAVKALMHFDRNGFAYLLDRATGALLKAEKFGDGVNWARAIDPVAGRPLVNARYSTEATGPDATTTGICPAALGSKNQQPAAFNPANGLFYLSVNHLCMDYEPFHTDYVPGMPYIGAKLRMYVSPGRTAAGSLIAWDPIQARVVQSAPESLPIWGGVLVTAGGIACVGTLDGFIKCVDTRDVRRELWRAKLPSGVVGNAFTYMHAGVQYLGVYSGVSGWPMNALSVRGTGARETRLRERFAEVARASSVAGQLTVFELPASARATRPSR